MACESDCRLHASPFPSGPFLAILPMAFTLRLIQGRELMFPPLYPVLIAAGSYLTRDFYVAAQLVVARGRERSSVSVCQHSRTPFRRSDPHRVVGDDLAGTARAWSLKDR